MKNNNYTSWFISIYLGLFIINYFSTHYLGKVSLSNVKVDKSTLVSPLNISFGTVKLQQKYLYDGLISFRDLRNQEFLVYYSIKANENVEYAIKTFRPQTAEPPIEAPKQELFGKYIFTKVIFPTCVDLPHCAIRNNSYGYAIRHQDITYMIYNSEIPELEFEKSYLPNVVF